MVYVFANDVDASYPGTFVKDSAITTAIKSKLAAQHIKSLTYIHVDTDDKGVVWLSCSASSDRDAKKAETIARQTGGVRGIGTLAIPGVGLPIYDIKHAFERHDFVGTLRCFLDYLVFPSARCTEKSQCSEKISRANSPLKKT